MMVLIFCILLLAVLMAWIGKRRTALAVFAIAMVLALGWFVHHITDALTIQL